MGNLRSDYSSRRTWDPVFPMKKGETPAKRTIHYEWKKPPTSFSEGPSQQSECEHPDHLVKEIPNSDWYGMVWYVWV